MIMIAFILPAHSYITEEQKLFVKKLYLNINSYVDPLEKHGCIQIFYFCLRCYENNTDIQFQP
ncbi:hypothetical protein H1P_6650004 [Hyella patelloides LEGE 07179]|uniref:Uncharacterized protein n=1 Tax=Hyella patelloides LEGE 07179 TaxID=945734 RepID=A0A563W2P7_9CYAN|nr:hypothetical protein H1P_6650004 [Hyella patelloides LEGE 07179]